MFVIFTPIPGEMIQFDVRIFFNMGWFKHQPVELMNLLAHQADFYKTGGSNH